MRAHVERGEAGDLRRGELIRISHSQAITLLRTALFPQHITLWIRQAGRGRMAEGRQKGLDLVLMRCWFFAHVSLTAHGNVRQETGEKNTTALHQRAFFQLKWFSSTNFKVAIFILVVVEALSWICQGSTTECPRFCFFLWKDIFKTPLKTCWCLRSKKVQNGRGKDSIFCEPKMTTCDLSW